jgi:hypothetical protein
MNTNISLEMYRSVWKREIGPNNNRLQHTQKLPSLDGGGEEVKADTGGRNLYVEPIRVGPLYHMRAL